MFPFGIAKVCIIFDIPNFSVEILNFYLKKHKKSHFGVAEIKYLYLYTNSIDVKRGSSIDVKRGNSY